MIKPTQIFTKFKVFNKLQKQSDFLGLNIYNFCDYGFSDKNFSGESYYVNKQYYYINHNNEFNKEVIKYESFCS